MLEIALELVRETVAEDDTWLAMLNESQQCSRAAAHHKETEIKSQFTAWTCGAVYFGGSLFWGFLHNPSKRCIMVSSHFRAG